MSFILVSFFVAAHFYRNKKKSTAKGLDQTRSRL